MSNLNNITLNGRIPNFNPVFNKGEGEKKSFLSWSISVKRNFKKQDEQYYPEDLIRFKAFGGHADFIYNNFKAGDGIILMGRLQKDDDYTDNDGVEKKGQLYVLVTDKFFADGKKMNGTSAGNNNAGSQEANPSRPGPASRPGPGPASRPGPRPTSRPTSRPGIRPGAR